jgi:hypothetical protein
MNDDAFVLGLIIGFTVIVITGFIMVSASIGQPIHL